jgi:hypothetical protein
VDRAQAVDDLARLVERLARHAVGAGVGRQVDVPLVVQPLDQLLDRLGVALLGGADEVVVGDLQPLPHLTPAGNHLVAPLDGGHAVGLGGLGYLLAVLVGSGEEEDLLAGEPVVTDQEVGVYGRVGVPDVGNIIHVVDGCSHIEGLFLRLIVYGGVFFRVFSHVSIRDTGNVYIHKMVTF